MPRRPRGRRPESRRATPVDALAEVAAQVDAARSRGAQKRLAAAAAQDPELRGAIEALARRRGHAPDASWPEKKLVRAARARSAAAQVRRNPIRRDTAFVCGHCGVDVAPGGGRVRDHCPRCLRSRHVDDVPGDRAAECGGLLDPVGFELDHGETVILYRCRTCGYDWRGRAHPDDALPPGLDVAALPGPVKSEAHSALSKVDARARTLALRVLDHIKRARLWAPGDPVVVAVSGGLDSTVMLEVLNETMGAHGGALTVVSIDHGLRPESAGEVAQVGRRAADLGLAFRGRSVSVAPGPNLAERARAARWAALTNIAAGLSDRAVIATAHHADDQAETVLQHLLRGSGARGLRGMQPRDGRRVRPLLLEPRAVLERFAVAHHLACVVDPSNAGSERGRIRALVPQLEGLRAGAMAGLARSARLLAREDALLTDLTEARFSALSVDGGLSVAGWQQEPEALQLRLLRRLVASVPHGVAVRADQLEALLGGALRDGARYGLSQGYAIEVRRGVMQVATPE